MAFNNFSLYTRTLFVSLPSSSLSLSLSLSKHRMAMQDSTIDSLPSCFAAGERLPAEDATKPGQSVVTSVYRTKIAGRSRLISVTWSRDVLARGLAVSVDGGAISFKVEMRPWHFWRRHGSRRFHAEGRAVDVAWDLRGVKFGSEPEPRSGFFLTVASDGEVALLLGDGRRKEAHRRTACRPAAIDAALVSRSEHVFGRTRFAARARLQDQGRPHEIEIEYRNSSGCVGDGPEMVVKIDGATAVHVKHLQWKFRGNECVTMNSRSKVDVYWDVHDWLFSPGLRHAMFIFRPISLLSPSMPLPSSSTPLVSESSGFCFFLYAWKSN